MQGDILYMKSCKEYLGVRLGEEIDLKSKSRPKKPWIDFQFGIMDFLPS
jgi:hypothetical protein